MTLVIGADEAGYGPNLGPLAVAATAWRVAAPLDEAEAVLTAALAAAGPTWADSKSVYRAGAGFANLEAGALIGVAAATGGVPGGWPGLAAALDIPPEQPAPGLAGLTDLVVPQEADATAVGGRAAAVRRLLAERGVFLVSIRCRLVQPAEFNAFLDQGLNKSDILSQITLTLVADLATGEPAARGTPTLVWCDRHGGRKRYAGVVSRHFGATLVRPLEETAARSVYAIPECDCRIEFCVGGEARAPVALASMTAKYVRELAMRSFNGFWGRIVPGLAATAGYPLDAVRWRREAAAAVVGAGCGWDSIWRRA
jgi:hypothetical protein